MIALQICKTCIEQCSPEEARTLMELMPEKWQEALLSKPTPIYVEQLKKKDALSWIHISWLAPHLRTFSEGDIHLYLAALEPEKAKELQKILGAANHLPHLTKLARSYLRQQLLNALTEGQELLPSTLLPSHPCNALLALNTKIFVDLFYYWGLHDLAYEMRKIISTAELKKIFHSLSKPEGEYLKALLLQHEPLIFKRLFLQGWDGEKGALRARLEERGAQRLGALLFGADESLVWHLTHRLEMSLAAKVLKYRQKNDHPRAEQLLTAQLNGILSRVIFRGAE